MLKTAGLVAIAQAALTVGLVGQNGSPSGNAGRVSSPPVVDGRLDDNVWAGAQRLTGFTQNEPFEGQPATERTEVVVLYDDDALYIGAFMFDTDPSAIVTGETRRDATIDNTDALVLVLDTYLDRQNGFVFGTTPAGIEYDGQVTGEGQGGSGGGFRPGQRTQRGSGGGFNVNWDGSWDVAASRDEQGWYAEFRIPFTTLRYEGGGAPQTWGLNVSRNIRRKNEQSFWAPVPRQFNIYRVSQAGSIGLEPPLRRTISITPYALSSSSRDYATQTEFDGTMDFGGDAKIGLTPSLALDLTVNTDFAQVEVDDQQVNLTRFALFFPEKRPFFLENAGTFSVGSGQSLEMFFSRRIGIAGSTAVPILGGGRVTGKIGGMTVGLLNIQTDEVMGVVNPNNFSVARVFREFPNRTRIGAMAVGRVNTDNTADDNWTYAVDGRIGIGTALTFDGYVAQSVTPGATGRENAFQVGGRFENRDWVVLGSYREIGDAFNPEVGFLTRMDDRFYSVRIQRNVRFEDRFPWFREWRPHISIRDNQSMDPASVDQTRVIHVDSHFEFSNGAFFQLPATNFTREAFDAPFPIASGIMVTPGTYDNVELGFAYNTNLSAPVSLQGRITIGGFLDGDRRGSDATLNMRFGETLVTSARVAYNDVNLVAGDFETFLTSVRVAYSFTPRIYLQSLVQYNDQSETFSSNVRFGWLNTAGTGLFIVFNDIERTADMLGNRLDIDQWQPEARGLTVKFTQLFNLTN